MTSSKVGNGSVTGAKLGDGSVTEAKLGNGSASAAKLMAGAIGASVTLVAGEEGVSVPAGEFLEVKATCPSGKRVISGGFESATGQTGL